MDIAAFLAAIDENWDDDPQTADFPRDRRFRSLLDDMGGMGTENKFTLLNTAARHLASGELYLEVGAYRGTSILAAATDNRDKRFVTIDNFSEFGGPLDECRANIERWGNGNITLINADVWNVLNAPEFREPVGVYFYDGGHHFSEQWRALEQAEPLLADEAIVIIDDTRPRSVATANHEYTRGRSDWTRVLEFTSPDNAEPRWWNGIEVYAFRRTLRSRPTRRFPRYYRAALTLAPRALVGRAKRRVLDVSGRI